MLKFFIWFCVFFVCLFITSHITWAYIQMDWQPFYEWEPISRGVHLYSVVVVAGLLSWVKHSW